MSNDSPGLRSMNERLSTIESELNVQPKNFIEKMVLEKKKIEHTNAVNKYNGTINMFKEEVCKWISDPLKQIFKLIELAVIFVEKHSDAIAYIFDLVKSSDFKLHFAIELIKMIIEIIDLDFIVESIKYIVGLLFPKKQINVIPEEHHQHTNVERKRKKKWYDTLSIR